MRGVCGAAVLAFARTSGQRQDANDGIDFAAGKIRTTLQRSSDTAAAVVSSRVCPLFPELSPYLENLYELAKPVKTFVISWVKRASNLRTRFETNIERTRHDQWPKLFQNLRVSRETELQALYPAKDVSSWLGNSVPVAMKHYAMAREETFETATTNPAEQCPKQLTLLIGGGDAKNEAAGGGAEWSQEAS